MKLISKFVLMMWGEETREHGKQRNLKEKIDKYIKVSLDVLIQVDVGFGIICFITQKR